MIGNRSNLHFKRLKLNIVYEYLFSNKKIKAIALTDLKREKKIHHDLGIYLILNLLLFNYVRINRNNNCNANSSSLFSMLWQVEHYTFDELQLLSSHF
jgi:hypothetical protein